MQILTRLSGENKKTNENRKTETNTFRFFRLPKLRSYLQQLPPQLLAPVDLLPVALLLLALLFLEDAFALEAPFCLLLAIHNSPFVW